MSELESEMFLDPIYVTKLMVQSFRTKYLQLSYEIILYAANNTYMLWTKMCNKSRNNNLIVHDADIVN